MGLLKILMFFSMANASIERPCVHFLTDDFTDGRKVTQIALGILYDRSNRVLMGKRKPPQDWIDLWELPGGKVERSESAEEALVREFREEVGLEVTVEQLLQERLQEFDSKLIRIRFYVVRSRGGTPQAIAHSALAWVGPGDMEHYPFLVPNEPVFEKIWIRESTASATLRLF